MVLAGRGLEGVHLVEHGEHPGGRLLQTGSGAGKQSPEGRIVGENLCPGT